MYWSVKHILRSLSPFGLALYDIAESPPPSSCENSRLALSGVAVLAIFRAKYIDVGKKH